MQISRGNLLCKQISEPIELMVQQIIIKYPLILLIHHAHYYTETFDWYSRQPLVPGVTTVQFARSSRVGAQISY